jgi:hypothetical protein
MKPANFYRILADSATGNTEIYPSSLMLVSSRCLMLNPKNIQGPLAHETEGL